MYELSQRQRIKHAPLADDCASLATAKRRPKWTTIVGDSSTLRDGNAHFGPTLARGQAPLHGMQDAGRVCVGSLAENWDQAVMLQIIGANKRISLEPIYRSTIVIAG